MGVSEGDEEQPGPSDAERMVFDALWTGVVNGWESDERHQSFLEHVARTHAFTEAARRYGALKDDEQRGEEAKKRLSAVTVLATQELFATKSPVNKRRVTNWTYAVGIVVCLGLLGWATFAYLGHR